MKVTKEKAAQNKEAILQAASRLYRERGIEGIGIGELAKSVGLTHGGFYGQFPGGKEQLACEAVRRAFNPESQRWQETHSVEEIVECYLSEEHITHEGEGCPIPALAADAARNGGPLKTEFTHGVRELFLLLADRIEGPTQAIREAQAAQVLTSIVGAVSIARALDDPALSAQILGAVKNAWSPDKL